MGIGACCDTGGGGGAAGKLRGGAGVGNWMVWPVIFCRKETMAASLEAEMARS